MAITKIGEALIKKANPYVLPTVALGSILGAARAGTLSEKEKAAMRKKYNLDDDANLTLRNAGRGAVGTAAGGLLGTLVGRGISLGSIPLMLNPKLIVNHPGLVGALGLGTGAAAILSGPIGAAIGAIKSTNKYS